MESDAEEEALRRALEPTQDEAALLTTVSDTTLRDKLLFLVLRAEVGILLDVYVCPTMNKSDNFSQFNIEEAVKGQYIAAKLERKRESPPLFALSCSDAPELQMIYEGDKVQDKLIEYFNKDLIRFEDKV